MVCKLKMIETLTKAHDLFGKGKGIYDRLAYIRKVSRLDPKDAKAIKKFVGLSDSESRKLRKILDSRRKTAEAAAKAVFPVVSTENVETTFGMWLKHCEKYGKDSKQEIKARLVYLKALENYDVSLRERMGYCAILIKRCSEQRKVHLAIASYMRETSSIILKLARLPSYSTSQEYELRMLESRYQFVEPSAKAIAKAYGKLESSAKPHQKELIALKKLNDQYIYELRKKSLGDFFKKSLAAVGIAA